MGRLKWVQVGRMLTSRYSHAVSDVTFDPIMKSDCVPPTTTSGPNNDTTTTRKPKPSATMALRGNVCLLTVIAMFAMFS